jgi:hypothetical protein
MRRTATRIHALQAWLQPLRRLVVLGLTAVVALNPAACSGTTASSDVTRTAANIATSAVDLSGNESIKSAPVMKVATGDHHGAIHKGGKLLPSRFDQEQPPTADKASTAVGSLIKLLSALLG